MNEYEEKIAKKILNKNKDYLYLSEYELAKTIHEFYKKCIGEKTECDKCNIVKNNTLLGNSNLCLSRYIYEKHLNIK